MINYKNNVIISFKINFLFILHINKKDIDQEDLTLKLFVSLLDFNIYLITNIINFYVIIFKY